MKILFLTLLSFFFSFLASAEEREDIEKPKIAPLVTTLAPSVTSVRDGKDEIQHKCSSSVTTLVHNFIPIEDENNEVEEETTPTSAAPFSEDEEEQTSAASSSNTNRASRTVCNSLETSHLPKVEEGFLVIHHDNNITIKLGSDYFNLDAVGELFEKYLNLEYVQGKSGTLLPREIWEQIKSQNECPIPIAVNKIFAVAVGIPTSTISLTANALYKTAESIYGFPLTLKTAAASLLTRLCKRKDK